MRAVLPRHSSVVMMIVGFTAVAVLSGCTEPPTAQPTRTAATSAPVFASDEEALAAAEKAYAAYLDVTNAVSRDGGANPERYKLVASGDGLKGAEESARQFRESRTRLVGSAEFDTYRLQSARYVNPTQIEVILYICDDVSGTDVVDESGVSIVGSDRPLQLPFEVIISGSSTTMSVSKKSIWNGENYC